MRLEGEFEVAEAKLVYLLSWRPQNDKSGFLAQIGYTIDSTDLLREAILQLVASNEATYDRTSEYGEIYNVRGELIGPNGSLIVVTVWIQETAEQVYRFITLKPGR